MLSIFVIAILAAMVAIALVDLIKTFLPNLNTIAKTIISVIVSLCSGLLFYYANVLLETFVGKLVFTLLLTVAITQVIYNYIAKFINNFKN